MRDSRLLPPRGEQARPQPHCLTMNFQTSSYTTSGETAAGAENFATLRSVLSTARKQGWSLIETLQESPDAIIAKIKTA